MRRTLAVATSLFLFTLGAVLPDAGALAARVRCPQCGMYTDGAPRWNAGLTTRANEAKRFDTPRCLLLYLRRPEGAQSRDVWLLDYYTQRRVSLADARFVVGSDVIGPMGPDFVPLSTDEAAERFKREHRGTRVLRHAQITPEILRARR